MSNENTTEIETATETTPTKRSKRWSGTSTTNARHLQNMLRGGDVEYFTSLSVNFGLAAEGNIAAAVEGFGNYLPEGALEFITQTPTRQSKADVVAAASAEAQADLIRKMFSSGVLAAAVAAGVVSDGEVKVALSDEDYASLTA